MDYVAGRLLPNVGDLVYMASYLKQFNLSQILVSLKVDLHFRCFAIQFCHFREVLVRSTVEGGSKGEGWGEGREVWLKVKCKGKLEFM